jgi:curved DNA-binding protein CbpA
MKLDSKYFDCIRVKRDRTPRAQQATVCQWKGCREPGLYRAPRGRGKEGQYYFFCLDHVRRFNASYNYFDGMTHAEVEAYQKDSVTGHRPTWKVGTCPFGKPANGVYRTPFGRVSFDDPHGFFALHSQRQQEGRPRRQLKPLELKSLQALDLGWDAERAEIKARFKELVKRHHPDSNGGDKRSEDKLREVIQAYNYLKQAGLV